MPGRVTVEDARQWALRMLPVVAEVRHEGAYTLQEIADALNVRGMTALHGGPWSSMQVWRLLRQHPEGADSEPRR